MLIAHVFVAMKAIDTRKMSAPAIETTAASSSKPSLAVNRACSPSSRSSQVSMQTASRAEKHNTNNNRTSTGQLAAHTQSLSHSNTSSSTSSSTTSNLPSMTATAKTKGPISATSDGAV